MEVTQKYFTLTQAQKLTGLSRYTWKGYAASGKVASIKLDKKILIPVEEIQRVMDAGYRPAAATLGV